MSWEGRESGDVEGERGRGFSLEPGGAFLPELDGGEADEVGDESPLHERGAVLDPEGAALCPALGGIDDGVELGLDALQEVHTPDDDAGDAGREILLDAGPRDEELAPFEDFEGALFSDGELGVGVVVTGVLQIALRAVSGGVKGVAGLAKGGDAGAFLVQLVFEALEFFIDGAWRRGA